MSKFDDWAEEILITESNHDLQPDAAAYMGWKACKHEVLKVLIENQVSEEIKQQIREI